MKITMLSIMLPLALVSAGMAQGATVPAKAPTAGVAKSVPANLADKTTGMEFVLVKGGCFQMGDTFGDGNPREKPAHEVCVKDFYLGKYEVTQSQWQKIMGSNPAEFKACGADCPIEFVSWDMVQDYIKKLNAKSKQAYRLPTEAEWEYAARSGGKPEKWAGTSAESGLEEYAWFNKNSGMTTHKVGQKKPNALGLYDMSGNVREWCQDFYEENYYGKSTKDNPTGGADPEGQHSLRGGDWEEEAGRLRTSARSKNTKDSQGSVDGFRLLLPVK